MNWYRNSGDEKKKRTLDRRPNLPLNRPWNHYHLLEPVDWDVLDVAFGVDDSLVFSAQREGGAPELFATSVHASTPRPEPYLSGPVRFPAVSPDGKWLAFARREGTAWQLWLLRIGTRETRRLTDARGRAGSSAASITVAAHRTTAPPLIP